MQGLPWPAYQGDQHVVFITDQGGVSQRRNVVDCAEGDIAFTGLEERFEGWPGRGRRLRYRRVLFAASAGCAARPGGTVPGRSPSVRLIGWLGIRPRTDRRKASRVAP